MDQVVDQVDWEKPQQMPVEAADRQRGRVGWPLHVDARHEAEQADERVDDARGDREIPNRHRRTPLFPGERIRAVRLQTLGAYGWQNAYQA